MRYFVQQHSLELAHEPKIKTVAQLVKSVSPSPNAAGWNFIDKTAVCSPQPGPRRAQPTHCQDPFKLSAGRTIRALQFNYQYKQLISATIVAGWDKSEGGQVSDNSQTFSSH